MHDRSELVGAVVIADVALILVVGAVLGRLVTRFRQPTVIGEILAGIALGPSLLGLLPGDPTRVIFPDEARPHLKMIAQVGLLFFMFGVGWEFEHKLISSQKKTAAAVSLSSIALSFGLGVALGLVLYEHHAVVNGERVSLAAFALFLGTAMSITAFPVLARILADNWLMFTRAGALALASAAIDDVLAWCLLALVAALATSGDLAGFLRTAGLAAAYVLVMALLVRPLLKAVIGRWAQERVSPFLVVVLCAGVLISSYATTLIGIHPIFGAFAFGVAMPREPAEVLRQGLRVPLANVSLILMPVFFIVTGLSVDISALTGGEYLQLAAIVLVACAGKMLGAAGPALISGMSRRESGTLAILVNTRGLTELIILNVGVSLGVLDGAMFTLMVLMALITTAMAGPLLPKRALLPTPGVVADDISAGMAAPNKS
ncbi:Na+/H+ antiporter [[Actinomadura] parvosata subsp. kistnae]|uniref:Cation/H(+) antiporter n=1 Tax=[Actinomadura] parvosata subsp. kistnae TaxID=1909395 RepID=A0A1V0A090_9ACTN|nr:cation:proton antiporter [Nonomuraea sp. ATCC 55076]AQZ63592.1 cation/H(+) antiporter [Nonomuraea sp. ATCC 55076]SPL99364.1 Na+/H+ antiporter [Actinomadura parvosata subsp. kistnae]